MTAPNLSIVPPSEWRTTMQRYDRGSDVYSWQALLVVEGIDIGRAGADGHFGERTSNGTMAWRYARGLRSDPVVDGSVRQYLRGRARGPRRAAESGDLLERVRFVKARHFTDALTPKHWIVLHSMEAPEASTTAENVANWFASEASPKSSAHYCIDADSVVQCVDADKIAWHAPGLNQHGIGLEHAGYARQTVTQWRDAFSTAMLERSARLCAALCAQRGIPAQLVAAEQLRQSKAAGWRLHHGITTHAEVSRAFGKSDHWDPGPGFPMEDYLRLVREALGR